MQNIEIKETPATTIPDTSPTSDISKRIHPQITIPAPHIIDDTIMKDQIIPTLDHRIIQEHFHNEGKLTKDQIKRILKDSSKILRKEPNLVRVDKPVTIIGDIHGQYYDLENLLKKYDLRKDTLLFLGDYVDRGQFSAEVYLLLLSLKIHYPDNIFLLRGNHETEKMTQYFTFKEECIHKYSEKTYQRFVEFFKDLPLAAIVLNQFYCAHSGISPHMEKVEDINKLNRRVEPPFSGSFCDILCSDPHPSYDNLISKDEFLPNGQRNCSFYYTQKGVKNFLKKNSLKAIVRGHEVQNTGYKLSNSIFDTFPSVITIFSAPNYCDAYQNSGAVMFFDGKKITITKFSNVSHPFYLPNFLDGINWSFPFVSEKTSEFYSDLLKYLAEMESVSSSESTRVDYDVDLENSKTFTSAMTIMRNERECLNELEDEDSQDLPCCALKTPENDDMTYNEVKSKDEVNEKVVDDERIVESSSVNNSPSCVPDISKALEDVNLKQTIEESEVLVDESKGVLDLKLKPIKKKKKQSLFCCFGKE